MDLLHKDFMRGLPYFVMTNACNIVSSIADIDQLYLSLIYGTNVIAQSKEWRQSDRGRELLEKRKECKWKHAECNAQMKEFEIRAVRQLRNSCVLHSLCYYALKRRVCVTSDKKQNLREQIALQVKRQFVDCLLEIVVECIDFRDCHENNFYDCVQSFSVLLSQNLLQILKTYQGILR